MIFPSSLLVSYLYFLKCKNCFLSFVFSSRVVVLFISSPVAPLGLPVYFWHHDSSPSACGGTGRICSSTECRYKVTTHKHNAAVRVGRHACLTGFSRVFSSGTSSYILAFLLFFSSIICLSPQKLLAYLI